VQLLHALGLNPRFSRCYHSLVSKRITEETDEMQRKRCVKQGLSSLLSVSFETRNRNKNPELIVSLLPRPQKRISERKMMSRAPLVCIVNPASVDAAQAQALQAPDLRLRTTPNIVPDIIFSRRGTTVAFVLVQQANEEALQR
jgi:hypothetical protein